MRNALFACPSLLILSLSGCFNQATVIDAPESIICIGKPQWPELMNAVKSFGKAHDLRFDGGIDVDADTSILNIKLGQYDGENAEASLDLWIMGMSSDPTRVRYSAMVRQEPTQQKQTLAHALLIDLTKLGPLAVKRGDEKICPKAG